jgi:aerobic carbon-monoxide dehydrogenase medium subunit
MPRTRIANHHRPVALDDAWRLLVDADGAARLLGGGTDLVVRCPSEVTALVDLAGVGLRYVEVTEDGGVRLGAMATFTDLLEHPAVAGYGTGVVGEMLAQVGSVLHRNSATIGGHVVRSRLSDVLPVLLALDASVVTYTGTTAELSLADYLDAELGPHVVTEVRLPAPRADSAAAFVRFSRTAFDHASVNACCRVDVDTTATDGNAREGPVRAARVVVGESAAVGRRIPAAEAVLVGSALTPDAVTAAVAEARGAVELHGDWIASAEYRQHLAGVAVERCLSTVVTRLKGGLG